MEHQFASGKCAEHPISFLVEASAEIIKIAETPGFEVGIAE